LEVFDEEHARFFCGREAIRQQLVEALRPTRFLCVLPAVGQRQIFARARRAAAATWPLPSAPERMYAEN
jgi:hypothetical protein